MSTPPKSAPSKGLWLAGGVALLPALGGGAYLLFSGPSDPRSPAVRRVEMLEQKGDIAALQREASRQDDVEAASAAVRSIGNVSLRTGTDLLPQLEKAIQHPKPQVRIEATAQLAAVAARQRVEQPPQTLVRAALTDNDDDVRAAAMQALGHTRAPDALDTLLEGLSDRDVQVRRFAFESLQTIAGVRFGSIYDPESPSEDGIRKISAYVPGFREKLKRRMRSNQP